MSRIDSDLKTDIFDCNNWAADWKKVQVRVNQAKDTASSSDNLVTEELVVNTLRSGEKPETIYWLLRYYVESSQHGSFISTDRGKSIFIEFDRLENMISVYVGATDSIACIGDENGQKIYTMDVQDKYDYIWYAFLGAALKRHYSSAAIADQASRDSEGKEAVSPTLFFTTGKNSICVMRTDWYQPFPEAKTAASESYEYASYVEANNFEAHSGNVVSVFNAKSARAKSRNVC